jgi:glycerol-3-phosphate dehydrogenase
MPASPFSARRRADHRSAARWNPPVDLLVVGGGITGCGIARDAAMRGLRTVLVEKDDLASGTSSRSSKLIHGGLRYLANLEFGLVFEAVRERTRLRQLAPHLCRPTPFLFPVYEGVGRSLAAIRAGLNIYDALSMYRVYKRHKTYYGDKTLEVEPGLNPDGLLGGSVYYDSRTDDARLTIETAIAAHNAGASILSHSEVLGLHHDDDGRVSGVRVRDALAGDEFDLQARLVCLAVGPWTDRVRGDHRPAFMRPTKGVHLVVDKARLPVRHAVVLTHTDGRIVFAIPWDAHTVLGTTDTDYDGEPEVVAASRDDVEYLLGIANGFFPDARLVAEDVVSTWAGLRPLVSEPGAASASDVSREHVIHFEEDGLIVMAGGKLTTYRSMAEELVDKAAELLRRRYDIEVGPCETHEVPLPGALLDEEAPLLGLEDATVEHLQRRYGSRWTKVAMLAETDPALAQPIAQGLPDVWAELPYAVDSELCCSVEDFLRRRTQLSLRTRDQAQGTAEEVSQRMAELLGWSDAQRKESLAGFVRTAQLSMAWRSA